jgi:hypothetical protein
MNSELMTYAQKLYVGSRGAGRHEGVVVIITRVVCVGEA